MSLRVNPLIVKEYDIRGRVPEEFNDTEACNIGFLLGRELLARFPYAAVIKVVLARDTRPSSVTLQRSIMSGLSMALENRLFLIDLGAVPTPLLYFASYRIPDVKCALVVTASHNPTMYNGCKILIENRSVYGQELRRILCVPNLMRGGERSVEMSSFMPITRYSSAESMLYPAVMCDSSGRERVQQVNIIPAYRDRINELFSLKRRSYDGLRVAWDCSNSALGKVLRSWHKKFGGQHILINEKEDGTFPGHEPDPTVLKNLRQLSWVVRRHRCHIGFAFDGDADRLVVVDAAGKVVRGETLVWILAYLVLEKEPGAIIVLDSKISPRVVEAIKQVGGRVVMWKTGHSLIKAKMQEVGATFAGEMSGHFFFNRPYYGYDDPIYAAMMLMEALAIDSRKRPSHLLRRSPVLGSKLGHIISFLRKPAQSVTAKFRCTREFAARFIAVMAELLSGANLHYSSIDGVRYENEEGWWTVRASNTEDMMMLIAEVYEKRYIRGFWLNLLDLCANAAAPEGLTDNVPFADELRKKLEYADHP